MPIKIEVTYPQNTPEWIELYEVKPRDLDDVETLCNEWEKIFQIFSSEFDFPLKGSFIVTAFLGLEEIPTIILPEFTLVATKKGCDFIFIDTNEKENKISIKKGKSFTLDNPPDGIKNILNIFNSNTPNTYGRINASDDWYPNSERDQMPESIIELLATITISAF